MLSVTPFESRKSATIVKLRSAMMESPASSLSSRPDFSNSSQLDMLPPYNLDTNEVAPDGVIHISVLWFLYEEKVNS